jgi:hypothetical protein
LPVRSRLHRHSVGWSLLLAKMSAGGVPSSSSRLLKHPKSLPQLPLPTGGSPICLVRLWQRRAVHGNQGAEVIPRIQAPETNGALFAGSGCVVRTDRQAVGPSSIK